MFRPVVAASLLVPSLGTDYTVLVVGDSWGSYGPKWTTLQDTFDNHGVPANVQSTAIGGTTACQWAAHNDGRALIESVQEKFPDLPDGPDFVWYTLGGNDLAADKAYKNCMGGAKSDEDAQACFQDEIAKINGCTDKLLETYWAAYPQSKVFQCAYDLQCLEGSCLKSALSRNPFCGSNVTCHTSFQLYWQETEIGGRQQKYPQPQYTGLNILGTVQKAAGVPGADVGKPVMDRGGPCQWEAGCIHPKAGSPAAEAIGEAFWDLFFSKYVDGQTVV